MELPTSTYRLSLTWMWINQPYELELVNCCLITTRICFRHVPVNYSQNWHFFLITSLCCLLSYQLFLSYVFFFTWCCCCVNSIDMLVTCGCRQYRVLLSAVIFLLMMSRSCKSVIVRILESFLYEHFRVSK